MQLQFLTLAFAAMALVNGASIEERGRRRHHGGRVVVRPGVPVCGGNTVAACCQVETGNAGDGENCLSPGNPVTINKFRAFCSATGRTASCCDDLTMGVGTGCQDI